MLLCLTIVIVLNISLFQTHYQLLVHGWWISPGTPASPTTKTGRHDIAEILLKVALNTSNQINNYLAH
jgi:hypothetical protein